MADGATNTEAPAGGEPAAETVESLKAQLTESQSAIAALTAESTKQKALRRKAEGERDALKKNPGSTDSGEDYKKLWTDTNDKLSKITDRARQSDIRVAATAALVKGKVAADKMDAALELIDRGLIEWDEDSGVSGPTVTAAVQKLKGKHAFLFETTVPASKDPKVPGDGTADGKTMLRSDFDKLEPSQKMATVKAKIKIVDA